MSPLGGGFLSGEYRFDQGLSGDGRLSIAGASGLDLTDRHWRLLKPLAEVADKLGVTMAQVAINWVATQPGVASAIGGAPWHPSRSTACSPPLSGPAGQPRHQGRRQAGGVSPWRAELVTVCTP